MILLGVILLTVCLLGLGYKLGWEKARKNFTPKESNPFIKAHQSLEDRDNMYEAYTDWCHKKGVFPLNNFDFFSELENNKKLKEQINKIMNG